MTIQNIDIDGSYTTVTGKYNELDFAFKISVSNYEIEFISSEFLDANNETRQINNKDEKYLKAHIIEWLEDHEEWHDMNTNDVDHHEWHQQNLEDQRMGN
jgi:hypothetical protein